MRFRRLALALAVPLFLSTACADVEDDDLGSEEDALDYRSTAGQEYLLAADVTFETDAGEGLDEAARQAAVVARAEELRQSVTHDISLELDRIWPEDDRTTRDGLTVQFRQASATYAALTRVANTNRYTMKVSGEFAGVKNLDQKLPMKTGVNRRRYLPVPTDVGAGPVELQVTLKAETRSRNAYPKYLELFADGLDVGVHFGGDHNTPPQDIDHARSVYDDLVASGFRSPVAKFEDLKIDSGPLTREIRVQGRAVPVRVNLFHVDMTPPDARQPLVDAYKRSMKSADVVIYDGHAGRRLDYSGVVLAYSPARVSVTADQFAEIETTDKQQVYVFNGCETYTGYADKLYENPKRNPTNTDVITTANYSAIQRKANQVIAFLHAFIDSASQAPTATWVPRSWDSVLGRMNAVGERSWIHVYGVHGIDDDPKLSPLADVSKIGAACASDADCGAADSRCLQVSSSRKACSVACADSSACPRGMQCVLPRGRTAVDDMQCMR